MPAPTNVFKYAISKNRQQIGCWLGIADGGAAELMALTGFDWLVIDGEHGPNDIRSICDQVRAIQVTDSHPVVRIPIGEAWMIKQVLDVGAQTVLVPMVETADQAKDLVRACRYPPVGIRGMGATGNRVSKFGEIADYVETANDQVCLLVQAESQTALDNLDEILAVVGVDGVFIGPADLSADMGHPGNLDHPDVIDAIDDAIQRIHTAGKPSGILTLTSDSMRKYIEKSVTFVAVGIDTLILANGARALSSEAKNMIKD
ncbi:HpcH/HpaI aldolase family protein [Pseudopelagicola sp. nBUS_19]|uniref:HpcH/HpaI aldolase family protein n=1 Tax=unclassified Pseudopelagicola TaxID=2649563 RepID=UPI003EC11CA0